MKLEYALFIMKYKVLGQLFKKLKQNFLTALFYKDVIMEKNLLKKYMNGVDIKKWNYYIGEGETVLQVMLFIINVIIKAQQFAYIKMIRGIYSVDMLLFLGLMKTENGLKMKKASFLP